MESANNSLRKRSIQGILALTYIRNNIIFPHTKHPESGKTRKCSGNGPLRITSAMLLCLQIISPLTLATTITVDSSGDATLPDIDGSCSLREAISAAEDDVSVDSCNAGSGADTIRFAPGISLITISADHLSESGAAITESLSIEGPGADSLEISGGNSKQLFFITSQNSSQEFNFSGLTLSNGLATSYGGAIYKSGRGTLNLSDMYFDSNTSTSGGGAVSIQASTSGSSIFTIQRSSFSDNTSLQNGGGALRLALNSQTTITDSSFHGNTSTGTTSYGGAIYLFSTFGPNSGSATLDILRSTFGNNQTGQNGGAIALVGGSSAPITTTIRHSTLVSNDADLNQADAYSGHAGGLYVLTYSNLTLGNTIIAGNNDISGSGASYDDFVVDLGLVLPSPGASTIITEGFNFIGANNSTTNIGFPAGAPNGNTDYVGTTAAKLVPQLQSLADNGGPTLSYRPMIGGNLVDKGKCSGQPYDQRQYGDLQSKIRVVDIPTVANGSGSDACDIGAIELGAELLPSSTEQSICFPIKTASAGAAIICL